MVACLFPDKANNDGQQDKPRPSVKKHTKKQEIEAWSAICTKGISRYIRDAGSEVEGSQGFALPLGPKDSPQDTPCPAPSEETQEAGCTEAIQYREERNVKRKL